MTVKEFNEVVEVEARKCLALLQSKSKEYNADKDERLDNFKAAAALENKSLHEVAAEFMAKHIVSIYQMIPSADKFTLEKWDEKICDAINYLLILKAILVEERKDDTTNEEDSN